MSTTSTSSRTTSTEPAARPPRPPASPSEPGAVPAPASVAYPSPHAARLPDIVRGIGRSLLTVDRTKISVPMAARNTVGTFIPLLACLATGDYALALAVGFTVNTIAISDQPGPDLAKFPRLMAATIGAALATTIGTQAGPHGGIMLAILTVWSFAAGMLAVFGPGALQVGICSILALLFAGAHPHAGRTALEIGGIILLAGTFQTIVSSAPLHLPPWLAGRRAAHPAEQQALAHALRLEARFARDPGSSRGEGPGNAALMEASRLLRGQPHPDAAAIGSGVLEACYRLQTSLLAVHRATNNHADLGHPILAIQATAMQEVARTIELVANALDGHPPDATTLDRRRDALARALDSLAVACDDDATSPDEPTPSPRIRPGPEERQRTWLARLRLLDRMRSLGSEVDTLASLTVDPRLQQRWVPNAATLRRTVGVHLAEARATITANLTTDSATFRHAVRLTACIVAASVVALALHLHHGYWAPVTATIILRPQFGITMTRGIARLIGTALGLAIGTAVLVLLPAGTSWALLALLVFAFCFRLLAPGNNVLATTMLSAWVVALLALVDVPPETTVVDRTIATLVGGSIALGLFLLWPTWERTRTPATLARMVDSLRATSNAVLAEILDPGAHTPQEIHDLRLASRLARSNAGASAARLAEEPHVPLRAERLASLLVAETRRLALAILSLENSLGDLARQDGIEPLREQVSHAVTDLDRALAWIASSLRNRGRQPPEDPSIALRQAADALQFAAQHRAMQLFATSASGVEAGDGAGDDAERRAALAAVSVGNEMQQVAAVVSAMCAQVTAYRAGQVPVEVSRSLQPNPAS